ncbi:hypothetical protein [Mycobacteroides abscessus]|uniref:hypothetical protein n=1 Tax=Mycobacteroides abscessus TaxID=36809 RepID=UPI001F4626FB|nr:hypothetical protein [Mycobacteroides abscessus]
MSTCAPRSGFLPDVVAGVMARVAELVAHRPVAMELAVAPAAAHNDQSAQLLVQPVAPERWRGPMPLVIGRHLSMPD